MIKVGIIGAMDEEVAALKERMSTVKKIEKASMKFYEGELCGCPVVVVRSGIGKVNGGICAQILSDLFSVTHIINTGIAGSLKNEIDIGDLVISSEAVHHDMDAGGFGYPKGQVPRMDVLAFEASEELVALAEEANRKANPGLASHVGRVVSGDQFVSEKKVKDRIRDTFDALCTEMEGAAIAQTAYLNKIPFVIIRAISDKADEGAAEDYPAFERLAIQHSVQLMLEMVKRMKR